MHIYFYRTGLALSEYNFTFNFYRVVIEKVGFKVRLRHGTHTVSLKQVRRQVRLNYCRKHQSKIFREEKKLIYLKIF